MWGPSRRPAYEGAIVWYCTLHMSLDERTGNWSFGLSPGKVRTHWLFFGPKTVNMDIIMSQQTVSSLHSQQLLSNIVIRNERIDKWRWEKMGFWRWHKQSDMDTETNREEGSNRKDGGRWVQQKVRRWPDSSFRLQQNEVIWTGNTRHTEPHGRGSDGACNCEKKSVASG